jgi:hypothetical protein
VSFSLPGNRFAQIAGATGICAALGGLVYLLAGTPAADAGPNLASMEQVILNAARHKPGDSGLALLFEELNARHFSGTLPAASVMWEGDLDRLDGDDYRLNGMTDGKLILLKAGLKDDDANVRRTLCHEMVHVKFIAGGNRSTTHDSVFQTELARIFDEGCFHAIQASPEEKASLKQWIESERTRLDAARLQISGQSAAVKLASDRVEKTLAELNERIRIANGAGAGWPRPDEVEAAERLRADSNNGIVAYNDAVAAIERDQTQFNEAVRRYNLILVYPDGLAEDRAKSALRKDS